MAEQKAPQMQATLGLTGLTSNAMALIAPGAFLWLTFAIQANTGVAGQPSTAPAMWLGIFGALLLCLATAVPTLRFPSSIPAPAPATITPSRRCSQRTRHSSMRAWPSSSSAGARTFTTGSIPA